MSASNMELPLSVNPACNASNPPSRKGDLEIPLFVRPSCGSNIGDYVAIVPLHHAAATRYLAAQRNLAAAQNAAAPASSSESTTIDDISVAGESSNESVFADCDDSSDEICFADCAGSTAMPQLSRTEALVASLRYARRRAHARRTALNARTDCAVEEVVADDTASCSNAELLAAVRTAREHVTSQRLALSTGTATKATEATGATFAAITERAATFAVTVLTMAGASRELSRLHSDMLVGELVERVADAFEIPNFAVRLLWDEDVLHMSQPHMTLHMAGIQDGSQLTLAKNFGWGKPDVTKLCQL